MKEKNVPLEDYFKIIDEAANNSNDFIIYNSDTHNASYLIKTLFHYAKQEVSVFTGNLFEGVFGDIDIKKEAVRFLQDQKVKLRVAFQNVSSPKEALSGSFIKYILDAKDKKGTIEIYNASSAYPKINNHFFVADRKAFRYELDHETRRAVANFGDSRNAKILADTFDIIITKSEKIFPKN